MNTLRMNTGSTSNDLENRDAVLVMMCVRSAEPAFRDSHKSSEACQKHIRRPGISTGSRACSRAPDRAACARSLLLITANACLFRASSHPHPYAGRREMRVRISPMGDAISALRSCLLCDLATSPFRSSAPAAPAAPPSTARQSAVRRGPSA